MFGITRGNSPQPTEVHDLGALEAQRQALAPLADSQFGRLVKSLKGTGGQLLTDSWSQVPSARTLGAMAGHATQQLITCGATTLAREEVFMHAYNAMLPALEGNAKWALLGAQSAISIVTVAANLNRHVRLQRLDDQGSSAGVRGQFGLSPQQWQTKTPEEQKKLIAQHHTDSRNVTRNAAVAEAGYMVMSVLSLAKGDGALAARILATQLRNLTYAGSRETLQASIGLTTSVHGKASHGVNESNMAVNGWTYTAMTLAMGYLQDAVINKALPAGQSVAGPALINGQGQPLKGKALTDAINLVAGVRALANTAVELTDAMRGKHYDLKQVGDEQRLQTDVKKMFPLKDYERLLDHSPARLSWNNISNATVLAAGEIANLATDGKLPEGSAQLINNLGTAAMFGMTYTPVNGNYGGLAGVRGAIRAEKTNQTQTVDAGSGVPVTERPRDARRDSGPLSSTGNVTEQVDTGADVTAANGFGPSTADVATQTASSQPGPGPSTQVAREAQFNKAVEPAPSVKRPSFSSAGSFRRSLEAKGASLQSLINAQEDTKSAVKQPRKPPVQELPATQAAVSSSGESTTASSAGSVSSMRDTVPAWPPQLDPLQPEPAFLDEFAELLKPGN